MGFTQRHLLGLEGLAASEIGTILDTEESFKEISERDIKKVPTLRGKTVINLFYEASTRTRTSFEIAAKRLSADTINISASSSSLSALRPLGATVRLVGPPTLLPRELGALGAELHTNLADGVRDADVIMMLRIQRERQGANFFPTVDEYSQYFCLTEDAVRLA